MEVTALPSNVSQAYQNRIELGFDRLKIDVLNFMNFEKLTQETIRKLESELNVYKLALGGLESKCSRLEAECGRLCKVEEDMVNERGLFKDSLKGYRVITLIDGDGAIFSSDLISQGQQGGHLAASLLSDFIIQYLSSNYGARPYQLWVYLFFNKRGLTDTLGRVGLSSASKMFEDFVVGFNQATERFTMVDVGSTKEAADAKLKVHLNDDIQLPQTFKIIFGGCHDNGYVSSLRSQITAGFREKIILLRGYTQMTTTIAALDLPILDIPNLFMTQKLAPVTRWTPPTPSYPSNQIVTDTATVLDESSKVSVESDEVDPAGASYSRVLQRAVPNLRERSAREPSPSTEGSWEGSHVSASTGTRQINPNLRLSKQKPPPCTLFYLSNCKHGAKCKYGHDYLLNDEHFEEMRESSRLGPCPMINRGEPCTWGDECCYGHRCGRGGNCPFYKAGNCKFRGADMHKDPAGA